MLSGRLVEFRAQRRVVLTSVTPNSLMVVFPPCSVPSSASICWKQRLSVFSSKSCKRGLSHCWSFSEFCCFNPLISCVNFSNTSSSNWLFGWLEPVFVPFWLSLSLFDGEDPVSSFRLFAVFGEGMGRLALRWAFVESASTLFGGGRVAAGIVKNCVLYVSSSRTERVSERVLVGRVIKRVGANYVRYFRASFLLPANLPALVWQHRPGWSDFAKVMPARSPSSGFQSECNQPQ